MRIPWVVILRPKAEESRFLRSFAEPALDTLAPLRMTGERLGMTKFVIRVCMFRFTPKRRENVVRLVTNASTLFLGGLVIGPFLGGAFRPDIFMIGSIVYFLCVLLIWFFES